jgi:hypothetical protein
MLDRGLARNLNDRFQSWDELIGRLKNVLHPYSLDEEDTLALAARLKRQLDISNPTTRLANLKVETNVVKEAIMKYVQAIHTQLMPTFIISMMGNFPLDDPPLPSGMTLVDSSLTTEIRMMHNPHTAHTKFAIMLRGCECVLLCCSGMVNVPGKPTIVVGPWQELMCFDPKNPPATEVVQKFARTIVNRSLTAMSEAAPKG